MSEQSEQGEPHIIRPYGDATGDGQVQVSFTLPIAHDKRAEGAALQLASKILTSVMLYNPMKSSLGTEEPPR